MKNKIYLVNYYENNFDTTGTYAYCSTEEIAREKKKQLEERIDNLHTEYWIRYKRNYKDDLSVYTGNDIPDDWEEISDRIIMFQLEYPKITYTDIQIQEENLWQ